MSKTILVTGGAGYIGSHTVLQLLLSGCHVAALDNLDNSSEAALSRVRHLAGDLAKHLSFHKLDLRDRTGLEEVFSSNKFDAVIHFAGLKAVGESVAKPLLYYNNNVIGTIILLEVMAAYGCKKREYPALKISLFLLRTLMVKLSLWWKIYVGTYTGPIQNGK